MTAKMSSKIQKIQKYAALALLASLVVIAACTRPCPSGEFTDDGECCTYVCDIVCPSGVMGGTCGCECLPSPTLSPTPLPEGTPVADQPVDFGDLFDDGTVVAPPPLPP